MAKISLLIALLPHLLCAMVQGQPSSCSEYFTYMTKPRITDMLGQIEIPSPSANDEFYLKVALNTATELTSQVVRLELARSIQESVLAVSFGRSLLYDVYYPAHEPTPSLSAIWFNNQRYCPGHQANDNIIATIELGHILYPPNKEQLVNNISPWQQISQPWHRNSSTYRIDNPSYDSLNDDYELNNECGITSYYTDDTNRLISNGKKTLPGQWPWHVAIYIQNTDNENAYEFKCAGIILTTRHVITEKFCIMSHIGILDLFTLINPQRVYVSFGQFNSRKWHGNHTGIINRVIVDYKIYGYLEHPPNVMSDYGLAILILKTAIEYNAFIRPVCLWSGSTDLQDIVNMTGYIVGWGYDVTGLGSEDTNYEFYTGEPRMAKVPLSKLSGGPIVPSCVPIPRYDTIMQIYNSYRPCYTDNGGGLVVFNTTMGRYQLRGIVYHCGAFESIRYIDVANQTSWIRQQISIT